MDYPEAYLNELKDSVDSLLRSGKERNGREQALKADGAASQALKRASRFLKPKPEEAAE